MAKVDLTAQKLRDALDYNPETGIFTWRSKIAHKVVVGKIAGCNSRGYISIRVYGRMYAAHRLAWLYVHGEWPTMWIDHINGAKSDNRIANLRDSNATDNGLNSHRPRSHNSASPYLGVTKPKKYKRWLAKITIQGKRQMLGCYDTAEEARDAYLDAKRHLSPESFIGT